MSGNGKKIGIVGVGLLGTAVAERLLGAGFEVAGFDVDSGRLAQLAPRGLRAAADAADAAAGSDAVFTILPTLDSVEQVILAAGGLLDTAGRAVLIQMSTISTGLTLRLAEAAEAKGIAFLDTPISGTSAMVARGDATILVGGDEALAGSCEEVFSAIGTRTMHLGPVGAGTMAKLCSNLLVALNTASLAEAMVLGAKGGIDRAKMLEVVTHTAGYSRMADIRGPLMVSGDYAPQMKLELFEKDMRLMAGEAERLGVTMPMLETARTLYAETGAEGKGGQDLAVVLSRLEALAGIKR